MNKYEARLFAPDGASVVDCRAETIEGVWKQVNDLGSRWIFYPIPMVVVAGSNSKTGRIVAGCDNLEHWKGKTCGAFSKELARVSAELPEKIATTREPELSDIIFSL